MIFQTISKDYPLILASASPRRENLLRQVGVPFRSMPSNIQEHRFGLKNSGSAIILAEKKAKEVYLRSQANWILGADTIVVLEKTVLGKPESHDDAQKMLSYLSGKAHKVITGFCLLDPSGASAHLEKITTLVTMKRSAPDEIQSYIATGEPFGKAGSYAIQGIGSFMVEAVSGSYSNVVGLPLCALIQALLATGALGEFPLHV